MRIFQLILVQIEFVAIGQMVNILVYFAINFRLYIKCIEFCTHRQRDRLIDDITCWRGCLFYMFTTNLDVLALSVVQITVKYSCIYNNFLYFVIYGKYGKCEQVINTYRYIHTSIWNLKLRKKPKLGYVA